MLLTSWCAVQALLVAYMLKISTFILYVAIQLNNLSADMVERCTIFPSRASKACLKRLMSPSHLYL